MKLRATLTGLLVLALGVPASDAIAAAGQGSDIFEEIASRSSDRTADVMHQADPIVIGALGTDVAEVHALTHELATRPRELGGMGMLSVDDLRTASTNADEIEPSEVRFAVSYPTVDVDGDGFEDIFAFEFGRETYNQLPAPAGDLLELDGSRFKDTIVVRQGPTGQAVYVLDVTTVDYVLINDLDGDGALELATWTVRPRDLPGTYEHTLTLHDGTTGQQMWTLTEEWSYTRESVSPSQRYGTYVTRIQNMPLIAGIVEDVTGDGLVDAFVEACTVEMLYVREEPVISSGSCEGRHLDHHDGHQVAVASVPVVDEDLPVLYPSGDLDGDGLGDVLVMGWNGADVTLDGLQADGAPLWSVSYPSDIGIYLVLTEIEGEAMDILTLESGSSAFLARARSGRTGDPMWTIDYSTAAGFTFPGDIVGDGGTDVIVFKDLPDGGLSLVARDGNTLADQIWSRELLPEGDANLVVFNGGVGDINHDGVLEYEFLSIECGDFDCALHDGMMLDTATGNAMWTIPGGYYFYSTGGDLDGDLVDDVSAEIWIAGENRLAVLSGATGAELPGPTPEPDDWFWWQLIVADFAPTPGPEMFVHHILNEDGSVLVVEHQQQRIWERRYASPYVEPGPSPANDDRADALDIVAGTDLTADTSWATVEANEPLPCGEMGATVWYRFVPEADGTMLIDTTGSDFDTVVAAYVDEPSAETMISCVDDVVRGFARQAVVAAEVSEGSEIWIQVGGWSAETGQLLLGLDLI